MGTKMSELREKDPAMYKAIRDKKLKKRAAKNEALALLLAFGAEKGDEKIKAAVAALTKRAAGPGVQKTPAYLEVINEMFKNVAQIHEDEVFKRFRLGRTDMRSITTKAIKNAKPEDRIWVAFDVQSGLYKLAGRGVNAPANWTGYRPLVVEGKEVK